MRRMKGAYMRKGRLLIIDKLFNAKKGSSYEKIIKETYAMMQKKRKKITIEYPSNPKDLITFFKKFDETKIDTYTELYDKDKRNTISYHNSIHQLIKIFDCRTES